MSKPRYQWWGYAKSMIYRYPYDVTPDEQRAVQAAIYETRFMKNGATRMEIVERVLLKRTHSLAGAALNSYISEALAKKYHTDFIRTVGKHFSCRSLIP